MHEFQSKQWGIYHGNRLIEGGFFSKAAAMAVMEEYVNC